MFLFTYFTTCYVEMMTIVCCRLSLQIEPPKGAESGTTDGMSCVDGGRSASGGSQLHTRAESAPCVKAHSFCCAASGNVRPLQRKTKTTATE